MYNASKIILLRLNSVKSDENRFHDFLFVFNRFSPVVNAVNECDKVRVYGYELKSVKTRVKIFTVPQLFPFTNDSVLLESSLNDQVTLYSIHEP